MRKLINSTYITIDGTVENPHLWPSLGDAASAESYDVQMELLNACDAVLMGRRTYESFSSAWPTRSGNSMADRMNSIEKLVVSTSLQKPSWNNTRVINAAALERIRELKAQPGKDIVQYGLGQVSFTLLEQGLMDEIRLWIHPIILGKQGEQLAHFHDCPPTQLTFVSSRKLANGIVIVNYACNHSARMAINGST